MRISRLLFCLLCFCFCPYVSLRAVAQPTEYDIKAGFLYNFLQFIEFPPDTRADTLTVCILGAPDVFSAFSSLSGRVVHGATIKVVSVQDGSSLEGCRVLFATSVISIAKVKHLKKSTSLGLLTIGEDESFLEGGGVIAFYLQDMKVRFAINVDNAASSRLQISSKLLSLAKVVKNQDGG